VVPNSHFQSAGEYRKPRFSFPLSNEFKMSKVDKQRWADDEEEEEVQVFPLCS
jgi:hypothetical protein